MPGLLGCFLDVDDGTALVSAAFWAGVMGQFFLMAAGALRDAYSGQKIMRAAECGAAR
jgi:hypothetical protein